MKIFLLKRQINNAFLVHKDVEKRWERCTLFISVEKSEQAQLSILNKRKNVKHVFFFGKKCFLSQQYRGLITNLVSSLSEHARALRSNLTHPI